MKVLPRAVPGGKIYHHSISSHSKGQPWLRELNSVNLET